MLIKLGIIAGIIILGGMIFSNEIDTLFPATSTTVVDSFKDDMSNIGSKATELAENRLDESTDKIVDKITDSVTDEIDQIEDYSREKISEASDFDLIQTIQNIFTGDSER